MFGDGPLLFREYVMREPLPLAVIHTGVIEFLRGREDAVLFGAQAVNAYVDEVRATQDVDILSTRAEQLAQEIKAYLSARFHIAVRVRQVGAGLGYRIYQVRQPKNRHLVDVRPVGSLPPTQLIEHVLVAAPAELIANKVIAYYRRGDRPKAFTDRRDLAVLLLAFPELKTETGPVRDRLDAAGADEAVLETWRVLVAQIIRPEEDDEEFS